MTTTFEVFKNAKRGNYCTLPTKDVPILGDNRVCDVCNVLIIQVQRPPGWRDVSNPAGWQNAWVHVVDSTVEEQHRITPRVRCRYCHSHEAKFRQHAWHDAVECPRCGGVDGYAIGD